jgi:hypothetical protein
MREFSQYENINTGRTPESHASSELSRAASAKGSDKSSNTNAPRNAGE